MLCIAVRRTFSLPERQEHTSQAAVHILRIHLPIPIFPIFSMAIVKDITNAVLLITWILLFAKLVDSSLTLFGKPVFDIAFLSMSLLTSLTQKNGDVHYPPKSFGPPPGTLPDPI